jgi:uncharacterized protein (TIGR02246 family)
LYKTGKEKKMIKMLSRSSLTPKFMSLMSRSAAIITTIVVFAVFPSRIAAETYEDSTSVYKQIERYQVIWNTHDAAALAELFAEDADFIMGNQPLIRGRKAIQNWWWNYFKRQETERRLIIIVNSVRIISTDVAVANVATTTGGQDDQGKELLARKARGTWVLHRQNGKWLIIAMRGMPTEKDQIIRKSSQ